MKQIIYGKEAREKLLLAAKALAEPVSITLGPKGKNVIVSPMHGMSYSTKDGVTVAGEIEDNDPFINAGIKLIRQASRKTVSDAGDGTTTSTVLASSIISLLADAINSGDNILELKENLQVDLQTCINHIKRCAKPLIDGNNIDLDKIKQVASISANNDDVIGELFRQAYEVIGKDGVVLLEESPKAATYVEPVKGMRNDRGFMHPEMANLPGGLCTHEKALVWVTDQYLTQNKEVVKFLTASIELKMPLIIFCNDLAGDALGTIVKNVKSGAIKCAVVTFPEWYHGQRDILRDIAIFTGSVYCSIDDSFNIDNIPESEVPQYLGLCNQFRATYKESIIVGANGEPETIQKRVDLITTRLVEGLADSDREFLLARISKLTGGIAILYAGGKTDAERTATVSRCEDAILAVRSAIEEGYVPGGGKIYLLCALLLADTGILGRALPDVLKQICLNAGVDANNIIHTLEVSEYMDFGYNAKTGVYEDLSEAGVVDSAKVIRAALENAVSIGLVFLNTDCIIAEVKDN